MPFKEGSIVLSCPIQAFTKHLTDTVIYMRKVPGTSMHVVRKIGNGKQFYTPYVRTVPPRHCLTIGNESWEEIPDDLMQEIIGMLNSY